MRHLSIGKFRGLQRLASPEGTMTCLALDHRQNLRNSLNPSNPEAVSDNELSGFKLEVVAALAAGATAVLLDPEYSAAQAIAARAIPNHVGLVVAVEASGYSGEATARRSRILPGWSVEKARRMGADAVKLLVYYHPHSSNAAAAESFIQQVAEDCLRHDLTLMLEPLSYSLDPHKKLTSGEKCDVVIETARRLTPLGIDLLKAEFPLGMIEADRAIWAEACTELSCASITPWLLLSAAVDFETYVHQVTVACQAGASGIAVGRAVWQEAVIMQGEDRRSFLQSIAGARLSRLAALCAALGKPVTDFYTAEAPYNWYEIY